MKNQKMIKNIVYCALMAALTCVATSVIQIPTPTQGYIHPGDGIVFLSGIFLGPLYGGLAAGIGSALVDLLTGYTHYVLGTFLIKALAAALCGLLYRFLLKKVKLPVLPSLLGCLSGASVIVGGYFLYASLYLGKGLAALSSIPSNLVQTIFGTVTAVILLPILIKAKIPSMMKS